MFRKAGEFVSGNAPSMSSSSTSSETTTETTSPEAEFSFDSDEADDDADEHSDEHSVDASEINPVQNLQITRRTTLFGHVRYHLLIVTIIA